MSWLYLILLDIPIRHDRIIICNTAIIALKNDFFTDIAYIITQVCYTGVDG